MEEELPDFIAHLEKCYRLVTEAGESISKQHRCYKLLQNIDESYDFISWKYEDCEAVNFSFKNSREDILNEFNRKKLKELNQGGQHFNFSKFPDFSLTFPENFP